MNCARCAWAYVTTAEIYCGHVQRCSFWFSECFFWLAVRLMHPSCIAVGCNQQLICRVMTPPAQHHTGTEHTQHLQGDSKGKGKTTVVWVCIPTSNDGRKKMHACNYTARKKKTSVISISMLAMVSLSMLWAFQHSRIPLTHLSQSCCQFTLCWKI